MPLKARDLCSYLTTSAIKEFISAEPKALLIEITHVVPAVIAAR
jgi:hypothetical protein